VVEEHDDVDQFGAQPGQFGDGNAEFVRVVVAGAGQRPPQIAGPTAAFRTGVVSEQQQPGPFGWPVWAGLGAGPRQEDRQAKGVQLALAWSSTSKDQASSGWVTGLSGRCR
jgi:hypothetical protein